MGRYEDLTGKTFGRLTVLARDEEATKKHKRNYWICQCKCGNIKTICGLSLKNGATKSCGCLRNERVFQTVGKNEIGKKYGKLTVIKMCPERNSRGLIQWICKCDCGNEIIVSGADLRSGNTQSCGCKNGISKGEQQIKDILEKNNVNYAYQYTVNQLGKKRFDFAIFDNNNKLIRLIEYDGEQHFKPAKWGRYSFERTQQSDKIKNEYALNNNIPLIRIPYTEQNKITLDLLFSDKYLIRKEE